MMTMPRALDPEQAPLLTERHRLPTMVDRLSRDARFALATRVRLPCLN
jgi:hypothetical protein